MIIAHTRRHHKVNMRRTLRKLLDHIHKHRPHIFQAGRQVKYSIPDQIVRGAELLQAQKDLAVEPNADADTASDRPDLDFEDFEV